jgi:hypothetical protein
LELAQPLFDPKKLGQIAGLTQGTESPNLQGVQLVSESNIRHILAQTRKLSTIPKSALQVNVEQNMVLSRGTSPLGKFVTMSLHHDGKQARIHSVNAGTVNEVPRDVFTRVLNGALLALTIQKGPTDGFYFVKENVYAVSLKQNNPKKLSIGSLQTNLKFKGSPIGVRPFLPFPMTATKNSPLLTSADVDTLSFSWIAPFSANNVYKQLPIFLEKFVKSP